MKELNVYIFWMGDENKKQEIIKKFSNYSKQFPNVKFNIGPTDEEHKWLLSNSRSYKQFYDMKIYSFMSDVYRVWKLSNNDGMYMDATVLINEQRFLEFLKLVENHDNIFLRESPIGIWSGLYYSTNQKMFKKIYNFFENYPFICKKILIAPQIISFYVYNEFGIKMKNSKKVYWLTAIDADPKSNEGFFKYNGMGSWKKEPHPASQFFFDNANKFRKGENKICILMRLLYKWFYIYLLPWMLIKRIFMGKKYKK